MNPQSLTRITLKFLNNLYTLLLLIILSCLPTPASAGIVNDIKSLPTVYDETLLTSTLSLSNLLNFLPLQSPTRCSSLSYSPAIDYSTNPDVPDTLWSWSESDPLALTEVHTSTRFDNVNNEFLYTDVETVSAEGKDVIVRYTKVREMNFASTTSR